MSDFNIDILTYLVPMFVPLWLSVYLFSRNPHDSQNRLTALTIFTLFGYFLFGTIQVSLQNDIDAYILVQRLFIWTIDTPAVLWLLLAIEAFYTLKKESWLKNVKIFSFVYLASFIFFGLFTNLIFDYSKINIDPNSLWPVKIAVGILYLPNALILFGLVLMSAVIFYRLSKETKVEVEKKKFLTLVLGSLFFFFGGLYLGSNIFFQIFYTELPGVSLLLIGILVIIFGSIKYKGLRQETPFILSKEFIYSTIIIFLILLLYLFPVFLLGIPIDFKILMLMTILITLVQVTHSLYDWIMSYARNIFTLNTFQLPAVTDEEIITTLRNLSKPEKLEDSSLLRLKLVNSRGDKLDNLRDLINRAIEYFEPKEPKRNKQTIKYEILKMISIQVEEGQILWDLGFEEYPLEIAEKADGQKPRLAIERPTDYQATSRNAFISLKKEAIHDLAWRISYLEKNFKS